MAESEGELAARQGRAKCFREYRQCTRDCARDAEARDWDLGEEVYCYLDCDLDLAECIRNRVIGARPLEGYILAQALKNNLANIPGTNPMLDMLLRTYQDEESEGERTE